MQKGMDAISMPLSTCDQPARRVIAEVVARRAPVVSGAAPSSPQANPTMFQIRKWVTAGATRDPVRQYCTP
jgi:hypothetical protein